MTIASRQTGQRGEQIAQAVLRGKGFDIEAVNWRLGRAGEIDLVAYHPQEKLLVFVEVKARKSAVFGTPQEAVNRRKQERILALAESYLEQRPIDDGTGIRFDVISVYYPGRGRPAEIAHIENAFCTPS